MAPRAGAARTAPAPTSEHVIKILISTDNHLGYLEKDPVRGDDSFRVFEEVLELAKSNSVDMLLLAGDLFHENKPSRNTLITTMRLLRRHCLSPDGEVRLAVRSDPSVINYMDPCVAVSLPVFAIHGNHDDPTGGAGKDALSSLDLLSHAGLVTYFGRAFSSRKVEIAPILLQKGRTALALYGLGNVRDEILYDTWAKQKRVKWLSPAQPSMGNANSRAHEDEDANGEQLSWFNLFVLHQNRLTRGSSKGITDTLLPPWLDYVVWGHEHDSLPDLTLSKPPIVQPGSTVATSLSAGEAKPKHAILLEIYKGKLKHRPVPLHTVRNFKFHDIVLSNQEGLSETDPEALIKFLETTVNDMVEKQESAYDCKVSSFQSGTSKEVVNGIRYPPRSFYIDKLTALVRQPLVRLRVEVTGNWETPSPQRFGQGYVGRVASAADIILFYRNKRRPLKRSRTFLQGQAMQPEDGEPGEDDEDGVSFSQTDANEEVLHIPKLVQYYLYHRQAGGTGLKFLELDRLSSAVDQFVNKLENRAIPDYVTSYLKLQQDKTLKEAGAGGSALDEGKTLEKFRTEATAAANRILAASSAEHSQAEGKDKEKGKTSEKADEVREPAGSEKNQSQEQEIQSRLDNVHAVLSNNPKIAAAIVASCAAQESRAKKDLGGLNDDDDVAMLPATASAKKPRASTLGRGRGRGRSAAASSAKRQTTLGRMALARATTTRRTTRKNSSVVIEDSDDEIEAVRAVDKDEIVVEDSEEEYIPRPNTRKRTRASASQGRSSRARLESAAPAQQSRRSAFSGRAKVRRNTATIDLEEESGDDAL